MQLIILNAVWKWKILRWSKFYFWRVFQQNIFDFCCNKKIHAYLHSDPIFRLSNRSIIWNIWEKQSLISLLKSIVREKLKQWISAVMRESIHYNQEGLTGMCYQNFLKQLSCHKCAKHSNCDLKFICFELRSFLLLCNLTKREK